MDVHWSLVPHGWAAAGGHSFLGRIFISLLGGGGGVYTLLGLICLDLLHFAANTCLMNDIIISIELIFTMNH